MQYLTKATKWYIYIFQNKKFMNTKGKSKYNNPLSYLAMLASPDKKNKTNHKNMIWKLIPLMGED